MLFPLLLQGQNTIILDPNFEQALIDLGVDKDYVDGVVPTSSVNNIQYLNISHKNIVDLTGIEAFTSLTSLNCVNNDLTDLSLSQNPNLTTLNCFGNQLTHLDVTDNLALTFLNCGNNLLSDLDLSNNLNLEHLSCEGNHLSFLDVSSNLDLNVIYCNNNQISYLDLIQLTDLNELNCSSNIFTDLNVGFNHNLLSLNCSDNLLSDLNVTQTGSLNYLNCKNNYVSTLDLTFNPFLEQLNCANNELSSLDLHSNSLLRGLNCTSNDLRCLNVKNGNNINFIYFYAYFNEDLMCIDVDDESYANANWLTHIDPVATFNFNCSSPCSTTGVDDLGFKLNAYPNPTNEKFTLDLADYSGSILVKVFDLSGRLLFSETSMIISLSALSKGAYLVQVNYESYNQMIQVIKE